MAFCRWLNTNLPRSAYPSGSLSLRGDYMIRIPLESEWYRAASWSGDDSAPRAYPYGSEFDRTLCNTEESGIGKTAAVGIYPRGQAYCGAMDMCGNILEWCMNGYGNSLALEKSQRRAVRGGSWLSNGYNSQASTSNYWDPIIRLDGNGFRFVLSRAIF